MNIYLQGGVSSSQRVHSSVASNCVARFRDFSPSLAKNKIISSSDPRLFREPIATSGEIFWQQFREKLNSQKLFQTKNAILKWVLNCGCRTERFDILLRMVVSLVLDTLNIFSIDTYAFSVR